ncbi:hypothetical protein, partial [Escherichia albertii]|uniref:hypothetical protein n=1 Tax=Escherichia albertii TaxID=208962 RepID=UPI001EDB904F
ALMTPVEYILRENKNCNMWWTHTDACIFQKIWIRLFSTMGFVYPKLRKSRKPADERVFVL